MGGSDSCGVGGVLGQDTTLICRCFLSAGIRQLQLILLKVALLMGVEVHMGVEFRRLLEPSEKQRPLHREDITPSERISFSRMLRFLQ